MFIASGRLIPRLIQRQYPTLSDSFLIASILNTIALFATDVMTYKMGGMDEYDPTAPEPSVAQAIALKKVGCLPGDAYCRQNADCDLLGHIFRMLFLRYGHISAKAGDTGTLLQVDSCHNAMASEIAPCRDRVHCEQHGHNLLPGYILVRQQRIFELVSGPRSM